MRTVLLCLLLIALISNGSKRGRNGDEAKAVRWLQTAAVPFAGDEPSAAIDRLADRLKTARVIGIFVKRRMGSHEDQAFKVQLIEALVRHGQIDVVAIEANHRAGINFHDYIGAGSATWKNDEFASLVLFTAR